MGKNLPGTHIHVKGTACYPLSACAWVSSCLWAVSYIVPQSYVNFECDFVGPTAAKMPPAIQQKISFNKSTSLPSDICYKPNMLQPYAIVQPGELHRHFAKFFSTEQKTRSLPEKTHSKSDTRSPESEANPSKNKVCLSRSLQDIGPFSSSPTDLDAPARTSSQDNFLQVPAMTTNAVMTTTTYGSLARPKSTSFIDITTERIYDNVGDLISPEYCTLPSG